MQLRNEHMGIKILYKTSLSRVAAPNFSLDPVSSDPTLNSGNHIGSRLLFTDSGSSEV